jgi:nucleoside 2-deoxyribosyltransferase
MEEPLNEGAKENNLLEHPQSNKIYIASFFNTRQRLRPYRDELWKLGYEITSTWLDETAKPHGMNIHEFFRKLAIKDIAEIYRADILIIDTIDVTPRGGREVELGVAVASFQNKLLYLVGPKRNVFHELVDRVFESWEECLWYMKERLVADVAEKTK